MKKLMIQLIKFGIVGVIAAVIDVATLMFLKEVLGFNVLLASALSFSLSVIVNYILSMTLVFKGSESGKIKEFVIFLLLSIGGLVLNQIIMWIGTDLISAYYLLVKFFSCVFVPIYNFITRKIFLEKKENYEE